MSKIVKISIILSCFLILAECGIYKPVDGRKTPISGKERARKNVEEGRGISLKGLAGGRKTTYQFSTSNPMWRATLEILDFLPLSTVDYSGGVIISDWYSDQSNQQDSIKISVRFLSNELQSNSLNIIVHKRSCTSSSNCNVKKIKSKIEEELKISILKKAALLEKESKEKKK
ncbi:MAG: hypothetical protein CBE47_01930 [Pelagibacteraceae bacterium TMED287]|nr:MAG: hypothetical protein CBE47_01930 [Pelagibacteraceae bacterium TMED287]|tara:strand:- start:620 stop:1138 length:519 start_codon:yes stop_codon:yes gene_type:complete